MRGNHADPSSAKLGVQVQCVWLMVTNPGNKHDIDADDDDAHADDGDGDDHDAELHHQNHMCIVGAVAALQIHC